MKLNFNAGSPSPDPRMPRFSIVTISFNSGAALRRTIESVNEQTHPWVEHVIVDGGSRDGSVGIIECVARRKVRWVSEADEGIGDAFNKGTSLSGGDFVCYLNAGDIFVGPDVLANVADSISRDGRGDAAVHFGDFYSSRDGILTFHQASARAEDFEWNNPINHQSAFVPRALALRHPYDKRLRLGMDYDLWLRIRREAPFRKLDFPIAVFASDGRSSDPAWSVHNLAVRRVLWHLNRDSRIEIGDVANLGLRAAGLSMRSLGRTMLGGRLLRVIRRWKARPGADAPQLPTRCRKPEDPPRGADPKERAPLLDRVTSNEILKASER